MSAIPLHTAIQQQAADPAHSVWLAAHAGTGKTKVLVDRMLRLLLAGSAPSEIVAITYTKAAAMEMQRRIREHVQQWSHCQDEALSERLEVLLARAPDDAEMALAPTLLAKINDDRYGLQIETIHGFCQSLLQRFPVEAGLTPDFTVLDDRANRQLLQQAQAQLLQQACQDAELREAIAALARHSGDQTIGSVMDRLLDEAAVWRSWLDRADGELLWRAALYEGLGLSPHVSPEQLHAEMCAILPLSFEVMQQLAAVLRDYGTATNLRTAEVIQGWLASSRDSAALTDFSAHFVKADGAPKQLSSVITKNAIRDLPVIAGQMEHLMEWLLDAREKAAALRDVTIAQHVTTIALRLLDIHQKLKAERNALNFQDLILYTLRLLQQPEFCGWVFSQLDRRMQHILLDEAQDTSPEQWQLTHLLVEELFQPELVAQQGRSLFVVGDRKQSIYRFQGADPTGFTATQHHLETLFAAAGIPFATYTLETSFRSAQAVLALVDAVCAHPACATALAEKAVSHRVFHEGRPGKVTLWPLIEKQEVTIPRAWEIERPLYEQDTASALLAKQLSQTIAGWLKEGRPLAGKARPIRSDDILILVRQRNAFYRQLLRQLQREGVPVAGADRVRFHESQLAQDFLHLAQWVLMPSDDYALAVVLKSPLVGCSEEQLFALAHQRGEASLWQRLESMHPDIAAQLAEWQAPLPVYEWLQRIWQRHEAALYACHGAEGEDVFHQLGLQALACESERGPGLQLWLGWMRELTQGIKREQGSGGVRVMTVHGAKGLQAPVVILPDTTTKPAAREVVWWKRVKDQAVAYAVPKIAGASRAIRALKDAATEEERAEHLRLLYVALTRAEDELLIAGYCHHTPGADAWYTLVSETMHQLGAEEAEDGSLRYCIGEVEKAEMVNEEDDAFDSARPSWWGVPPNAETARPVLTASHRPQESDYASGAGETAERAARRGDAIHLLLELQMDDAVLAERFLAQAMPALPHAVVTDVITEVQRVLHKPDLRWVFESAGHAELPLQQLEAAGVRRGTIDRVVVTADAVHVIDYKSNAQPPEIAPEHYAEQLRIYRQMLAPLYPDKSLRSWLLWTRNAALMEVGG